MSDQQRNDRLDDENGSNAKKNESAAQDTPQVKESAGIPEGTARKESSAPDVRNIPEDDGKAVEKKKKKKKRTAGGRFWGKVGKLPPVRGLRTFFHNLARFPVLQSFFFAFMLFLVIDMLGHRSFFGGLLHFFMYPHLFLLNVLIIWVTFLPGLFLRRRYFVYMAVGALWLTLGVVNFVLLGMRVTPFEAVDIAIFKTGFSIIHMYMSVPEIVLCIAAIVLALILLVIMWFKVPRVKPPYKKGLISFPAAVVALALVLPLMKTTGVLPEQFHNLRDSYEKYGFVYSFCCSLFDRGIEKPDSYSDKTMDQLMAGYKGLTDDTDAKEPNIIFLQLESFFNLMDLDTVTFNEDPTPFFNSLKKTYPHGYLTVPSIGAGTANTEFESIAGMSLSFFGTGEYPYKTVLQDTVCEAMPHVLAERGYSSTAIHNHTGTFYDRHLVYAQLGFDRYIAREYMEGLENEEIWNPIGWVRDEILIREIMNTLCTTEKKDYIYAVSVQGHGGYPSYEVEGGDLGISIEDGLEDDDGRKYKFTYFANQMRDMDNFLRDLTEALSAYDEEVVLVMYGDHLPSLDLEMEDFKEDTVKDLFETEYIIWSNFALGTEGDAPLYRDLCAYQTGAYVLDLLGIHDGNLIRYHQTASENYLPITESKSYKKGLHMLQYDILYGEQYVYDGEMPYGKTDMQMGLYPITIERVEPIYHGFKIYGTHFTTYSYVLLNGSLLDDIMVDFEEGCFIVLEEDPLEDGDVITIIQQATDTTELSRVKFVYRKNAAGDEDATEPPTSEGIASPTEKNTEPSTEDSADDVT